MVIPIHDRNPTRRAAVVTYAIILACFVVFLTEPIVHAPVLGGGTTVAEDCAQEAYFDRYAAIPAELVHDHQLTGPVPTGQVGVAPGGAVGCVVAPATYHKSPPLSVLFALFLHGGWLHLLGNMLFLYVFGNNVEDRFGRLFYLVFYLAVGYAATYAFALANPHSTESLLGASGAIAGVLGAYLVLFPRARVTSLVPFLFFLPVRLPAWVVLGLWFVLQYAYSSGAAVGAGAGVAYLAHVVGFCLGALVALPVRLAGRRGPPPPPTRPDAWRYGY